MRLFASGPTTWSRAYLTTTRYRLRSFFDRRDHLSRGLLISRFSTDVAQSITPPLRVAIIGSGPGGFYAARRLLSLVDDAIIDMYEQLPVPFGLVRYGVAPDHPDVKKCEETFTEVAESPRFNFIGNIQVGRQLPVETLLPHYNAVLFAYGASRDRELGLKGEGGKHVYSARAFVGWYNGLPEYRDLDPDLSAGDDAVIIGQGNVALDVARILLTDVDVLRKTDITDYALARLSESRIRNIRIVGRRGPVQAAFTIKEIRELLHSPNTFFNPIAESLFPKDLKSLPRPQRRLLELLKTSSSTSRSSVAQTSSKSWSLDFLLSPNSLNYSPRDRDRLENIAFTQNQLLDPTSPASGLYPSQPATSPSSEVTTIPAQTLFRSIGYKSEPLEREVSSKSESSSSFSLPFDQSKGVFPHDRAGRILLTSSAADTSPLPALYCAGWVKRGPTGVIASTMADAFQTAEAIAQDYWTLASRSSNQAHRNEPDNDAAPANNNKNGKQGWAAVHAQAQRQGITSLRRVSWDDWLRIDRVERRGGGGDEMNGTDRPRKKLTSVRQMLDVLDS